MDKYAQLEQRITELEKQAKSFSDYSTIAYEVEKALITRGFVSSHDNQSLTEALINKGGLSGTVYVASISGGAVTHPVIFENGIATTV